MAIDQETDTDLEMAIDQVTDIDLDMVVPHRTGDRSTEVMGIMDIITITTIIIIMADTTSIVAGIGRLVQSPLVQWQVWHWVPLSINLTMTV